jgi:hypothetical protein
MMNVGGPMNIVVFFSPGKTIDDLMMIDQCGTIGGLVDVTTYMCIWGIA